MLRNNVAHHYAHIRMCFHIYRHFVTFIDKYMIYKGFRGDEQVTNG